MRSLVGCHAKVQWRTMVPSEGLTIHPRYALLMSHCCCLTAAALVTEETHTPSVLKAATPRILHNHKVTARVMTAHVLSVGCLYSCG